VIRVEWIEHLKAFLSGKFWLDCPNCGHKFGGHEKGGEALYSPYLPSFDGSFDLLPGMGVIYEAEINETGPIAGTPVALSRATCNRPECVAQVKERNHAALERVRDQG